MGCDGGTIPKRDELVKTKKKAEQKDQEAELAAKWRHCQISQQPLQPPIVACLLGRLYNKEAVIEYLLDKTQVDATGKLDHIRGLKDVIALKFTDNPAYNGPKANVGDRLSTLGVAAYICPVAGLEMNGKHVFCYLPACGCVFSERALKEIKADTCNKCGKPCTGRPIIINNNNEEDVAQLRVELLEKHAQEKAAKKNKRKATEKSNGEAPVAKESKLDGQADVMTKGKSEANGGKASSSKLNGKAASSKLELTNGKTKPSTSGAAGGIQTDPKASKVFKSLFTTCEKAINQPKPHWVTYNPRFY